MTRHKRDPKYEERARQLTIASRENCGGDEYAIGENVWGDQYYRYITLNESDVWLDAGAHIGTFSMMIAPFVRKVIAYEIDHETYELLNVNLQNNCTNAFAVHAGVVAENQENVPVYRPKNYLEYSVAVSIIPTARREIHSHVRTECLDTIIRKYDITKLKLDIEGCEENALYSISDATWESIQEVICEWHFQVLRDSSHTKMMQMFEYLRARGFHIAARIAPNPRMTIFHASKSRETDRIIYIEGRSKKVAA